MTDMIYGVWMWYRDYINGPAWWLQISVTAVTCLFEKWLWTFVTDKWTNKLFQEQLFNRIPVSQVKAVSYPQSSWLCWSGLNTPDRGLPTNEKHFLYKLHVLKQENVLTLDATSSPGRCPYRRLQRLRLWTHSPSLSQMFFTMSCVRVSGHVRLLDSV